MAQDVTQSLVNPQQIEVGVDGPDGASRMFICCGQARVSVTGGRALQKEIFVFSLGPELNRRQFVRAVATAGLAAFDHGFMPGASGTTACRVIAADADWDDESKRVQVRVEVEAGGSDTAITMLTGLSYHVTIVAEI